MPRTELLLCLSALLAAIALTDSAQTRTPLPTARTTLGGGEGGPAARSSGDDSAVERGNGGIDLAPHHQCAAGLGTGGNVGVQHKPAGAVRLSLSA